MTSRSSSRGDGADGKYREQLGQVHLESCRGVDSRLTVALWGRRTGSSVDDREGGKSSGYITTLPLWDRDATVDACENNHYFVATFDYLVI